MPSKPKDCWLVVCCMPMLHPLARQPIAVYDNEQQAQDRAASLGTIERIFDSKLVPIAWIEKLPLIMLGEN